MEKNAKIFMVIIVVVAIMVLAGIGIMALWNSLVTSICGFAAITFWQSIGFFLLGQLLSSGFLVMLLVLMGCLHKLIHHHEEWNDHWHKMTDEERREFILRRREHFEFHNRPQEERS